MVEKLIVYISPDNGATADSNLIQKVYDVLHQNSPLTTWLTVKSAGKVNIILDVEVTGKKSYKTSEIQSQILSALFNAYSPENSDIGGSVRISDIYALIDNLESVDYLHLKKFYTKPWPTTVYGNKELILGQFQLDEANGSHVLLYIFFLGYSIYSTFS